MKLPAIDSKEIVPVRLIPLITNSWLGQETLVGILANKLKVSGWHHAAGDNKRNNGVHAYHLNDGGIPVTIWVSQWEEIYRDISVLEPVLRNVEKKNGAPDSMESAWRLKATKILPPGVFLWRDDFELLFQEHISTFSTIGDYDPPDFRKIHYDAYIRPEYRVLVWEGFEHLREEKKQRKSTMDDDTKAAHAKFEEAYKAVIDKKEKATGRRILKQLQDISFNDNDLHVNQKKKTFEYREKVVAYGQYKNWITKLNKLNK